MKRFMNFIFIFLLIFFGKSLISEQDYCFKYIAGCKPHLRVLKGINWPDNVYIVLDAGHCKTNCKDNGTDNKSYLTSPYNGCSGPVQSQTENIFGEVYEKDVTKLYVEGVRNLLNFYGYKNIHIIDQHLNNQRRANDAYNYFTSKNKPTGSGLDFRY
jgi:hypothetical protein